MKYHDLHVQQCTHFGPFQHFSKHPLVWMLGCETFVKKKIEANPFMITTNRQ